MKSFLQKLAPGVLACLAAFVAVVWIRAQDQDQSRRVQPAQLPAPVYSQAPQQPQQIIVCGNCGARIGIPQSVLVAQPIDDYRGPVAGQYFNGMPPAGFVDYAPRCDDEGCYLQGAPAQSIFPLSTQWRIPANRIPVHRNLRRFVAPGCGY